MAFEPITKEFNFPASGKKVVYRTEKVEDDIVGMKIASQGMEDKNDGRGTIVLLQKIKIILGVVSIDGVKKSIKSWQDYCDFQSELMQYPQDYKILEALNARLNGDAAEAETFVKNLLSVQVS